MAAVSDKLSELYELAGAQCEGLLTAADAQRLEQLVLADAELLRSYIVYMHLHAQAEQGATRGQGSGVGGQGTGNTKVESGEWRVESAKQRPKTQDLRPNISGQWPVVSGQRVESGEGRGESRADFPESPNPRIHESPVINPQIPRFSLPSPLSSLPSAWAFSYSVATLFLAVALLGAWFTTITHPNADALTVNNSRGSTPSVNATKDPSDFIFVGKVSGMVDCQFVNSSTATVAGAGVTLGRRYALKSGLMEIAYDSGAKVILQGPCEYIVESPCGGFLKIGKLVARVGAGDVGRGTGDKKEERGERREESEKQRPKTQDPRPNTSGQWSVASGQNEQNQKSEIRNQKSPSPLSPLPSPLFAIRTPTAVVTDLGTEFGVEVNEQGETASHVFVGRVVMRTEGGRGKGEGREGENEKSQIPNPKSQIILSAGQAARVERDVKSGEVKLLSGQQITPTDSARFARQLPRHVPIKLFNTGVGLKEGDPDSYWQIVARSDQGDFQAHPAVVSSVGRWHLANAPRRSQWISTAGDLRDLPGGVVFTFRTEFKLNESAAESAALRVRFIADDAVSAIRLNGRGLSVPEHAKGVTPFDRFVELVVKQGFIEGTNTLEIDVANGPPNTSEPTPMLLRVELEGVYISRGASEKEDANDHR